MTPEQIREVVKITLDELAAAKMLADPYPYILKVVEGELNKYFKGKSKKILPALTELADDEYIDIIYHQYSNDLTIEYIAEIMDKDVSTIKRNKKRLIKRLYEIGGF